MSKEPIQLPDIYYFPIALMLKNLGAFFKVPKWLYCLSITVTLVAVLNWLEPTLLIFDWFNMLYRAKFVLFAASSAS